MKKLLPCLALVAVTAFAAACTSQASEEELGDSQDAIRVTSSFVSRGTGYYPANNSLEGGFVDRKGARLRTLQQFLAGNADYVSVAMDSNAFSYGQRLRIKELEAKYGRPIVFRVVDTGGAFRGKGRSRMDICVANRTASVDPTINGTLHVDVIDERSGPPEPDDSLEPPADDPVGGDDEAPSGAKCTNDGACNPGNDGSGLICEGGRCIAGCRSNAQCPGATRCVSGQCR